MEHNPDRMRDYWLFSEKDRMPIGKITLDLSVVDQIINMKPELGLSYTINLREPSNILSFALVLQPAIERVRDTKIENSPLLPKIDARCCFCNTRESELWWKCCPNHTTEQGPDVVCQKCKDEKHPICRAVKAGGWGVQYTCTFEKHGPEKPHSWVVC